MNAVIDTGSVFGTVHLGGNNGGTGGQTHKEAHCRAGDHTGGAAHCAQCIFTQDPAHDQCIRCVI